MRFASLLDVFRRITGPRKKTGSPPRVKKNGTEIRRSGFTSTPPGMRKDRNRRRRHMAHESRRVNHWAAKR